MPTEIPKWIGDVTDPHRPRWRDLSRVRKVVGLTSLVGLFASVLYGGAAALGLIWRVFRWAAWGAGCP